MFRSSCRIATLPIHTKCANFATTQLPARRSREPPPSWRGTNSTLLSGELLAEPRRCVQLRRGAPHILVLGGGVIGLHTAWFAADRGYNTTVVSKAFAEANTNNGVAAATAGASHEFSPSACGYSPPIGPLLSEWQAYAARSRSVLVQIAEHEQLASDFGVRLRPFTSFHLNQIANDPIKKAKLHRVRHDYGISVEHSGAAALAAKYGVNCAAQGGLQDAYEHLAPVIDTVQYQQHLKRLLAAKGVVFVTRHIAGSAVEQEEQLLSEFDADAIVVATGASAGTMARDESTYELWGALLRVQNGSGQSRRIDNVMLVTSETRGDRNAVDTVFIVPRNDDTVVLGSVFSRDPLPSDLSPSSPMMHAIWNRCVELVPHLAHAKLDAHFPVAVGARPVRECGVRIERESAVSRIIWAYGHAGSGWSTAFATVERAMWHVEETLFVLGNRSRSSTRGVLELRTGRNY